MKTLEPWQRDFAIAIQRQREAGFGWRFDGVESWSNDAIFAKLHALRIPTSIDQFPKQAAEAGRIDVLKDQWDASRPRRPRVL